MRRTLDGVEIRDSKDRGGATLRISFAAWRTFIASVRNGAFDR
jgi:hypothetical protein